MRPHYKPGEWNVICDVCGFEFKSSQLKKRWDGVMVCDKDYETRHPQDLIRVPRENVTPPWTRPEASDVFIGPQELTIEDGIQWLLTEAGTSIITEG